MRDADGGHAQARYDKDRVPEIMVAYKDGQGYPEYLRTFTL